MTEKAFNDSPKPKWPAFVADVERRLRELHNGKNTGSYLNSTYLPTDIVLALAQRSDVRDALREEFNTNPRIIYDRLDRINQDAHSHVTDAIINENDKVMTIRRNGRSYIPKNRLERRDGIQDDQPYLEDWKAGIVEETMDRMATHDYDPITACDNFLALLSSDAHFQPILGILHANQQNTTDETGAHAAGIKRRQKPHSLQAPQQKLNNQLPKDRGDEGETSVGR